MQCSRAMSSYDASNHYSNHNMIRSISVSLLLLLFISVSTSGQAEFTAALNGLKANVTVRRDGRSIPFIEATNDADLYFAQGYVTASDRLWQMDLLRRVAREETAEIFGKAA